MKAVIVEIREHHAAVLTDDGCIIKIKNKNYAIGQVIEMKEHATNIRKRIIVFAASAAAAIALLGTTAWAYYTPYSYVSLDVNPSIEYSVNRFDKVLSAEAVNGDGAEILEDLQLKNKSIDEAIKATVNQIADEGYFEGEEPGGIMIATSSEDEQAAKNLADDLQDTAEETATAKSTTSVAVEVISIGHERVLKAKTLGTTPGKLNLVEKLQASSKNPDNINIEEWLNKPVKEIMKSIKANKKEEKASIKENKRANCSSSASSDTCKITESSKPSQKDKTKAKINQNIHAQANKSSESIQKTNNNNKDQTKVNQKSDTIPANNSNAASKAENENNAKNKEKANGKSNAAPAKKGNSDTKSNGNSNNNK